MKPLTLTMQAFASYGQRQTIDFTCARENLFLITGDTGSGKTTIFDAIVFALYGEASSERNKKDGVELQSQYAPYDSVPYVELSFTEQNGGEELLYSVKRTPRHIRPLKKGEGSKEDGESVSLTMPDGSEYIASIRETNEKIKQIVGLSKEQFMQVGMIAQGEFMELLRKKSDDRKLIFRKLFSTEFFEAVTDELAKRRRDKGADIARVKTVFRAECTHISVADDYTDADSVLELKKIITSSDNFTAVHMESLLEKLELLCAELKIKADSADAAYGEALKERDSVNARYASAESLLKLYEQKEDASGVLNECKLCTEEIQTKDKLAREIEAAYDICSVYKRMTDAREIYEKARANYEELTGKIDEFENNAAAMGKAEEKYAAYAADADLKYTRALEYGKNAGDIKKDISKLKKEAEENAAAYSEIKEQYLKKNDEYSLMESVFFDEQAGFIAKRLKEGMPCPVCGSVNHPKPMELSAVHTKLSREALDKLKNECSLLNAQMVNKSTLAGSSAKLLLEKQEALEGEFLKIIKMADTKCKDADCDILDTEQTARDILTRLKSLRDEAQSLYTKAREDALLSRKTRDEAAAGIRDYKKNLPLYSEKYTALSQSYRDILSKADTDENSWKAVCSLYDKDYALKLRDEVNDFNKIMFSAKERLASATEAIGDAKRPDIEELRFKKIEKEEIFGNTKNAKQLIDEQYRTNSSILSSLAPVMCERAELMEQYRLIDELYSMLAGKVTGQRMDIETYVQRYYLERVLEYANLRFADMSAGQFEFRMYNIEKAGEGKNRGLDLMVYSTVTGREREVRTLSGGESFMAALSLALGMADEIANASSSVNLDVMFIDEGFGSLDNHSKNQAIKVLRHMANGSKLIGIISHISELKQEIDTQLYVKKDENGSCAAWHIS